MSVAKHIVEYGRKLWRSWIFMALVLLVLLPPRSLSAWGFDARISDLTRLSIEDLMALEITTISRKAQRLADTAAAVFVVTQEDIHRSGATSIPEALRMVPGIEVARISADKWAISSRGFNGYISNKLLVLMDGRTVYNSAFSGVFWNVQEALLEDVERIEVIRGPGASLWGANAVNGVINIVTRSAEQARGGLLSAGAGTEERAFGALRYGGKLGESAGFTAHIKHSDRDGTVDEDGNDLDDDWHISQIGGRIDWSDSDDDSATLSGGYYDDTSRTDNFRLLADPPYLTRFQSKEQYRGYHLLGRWQRTFSRSSDMSLQLYYDRSEIDSTATYSTRSDVFDVDVQHRFGLGARQEIIWGAGYRVTRSQFDNTGLLAFNPDDRTDELFSFFIQDQISLVPKRLHLILGSKFEEHDTTGWEIQPNLRLLWSPNTRHTFWAAVSRAVRTPARYERDVVIRTEVPGFPGASYQWAGSDTFDSEEVIAYEAGYRFFPSDDVSVDMALFFNRYDELWTWTGETPYLEGTPPQLVIPTTMVNGMSGDTYGGELTLDWRPLAWLRLQAAYSFLKMDLHDSATGDYASEVAEGESPEHRLSLRTGVDLDYGVALDVWLKFVDELSAVTQQIPSYWSMDARIGWRINPSWEVALVGQNLFESQHPEFMSDFFGFWPVEIERGVYGKVTWRF